MDLCKVYYLCEKPNWRGQVAEEQQEMVTSFEDALAKETKDKTHLAITCVPLLSEPVAQEKS